MPKRRVTPRRAAQIAMWRMAGNRARSFSHPANKAASQRALFRAGKLSYTPPGIGGRRSKQGGKQYVKKTSGGVTVAPAVASILKGDKPSAGLKEFHASTIRGDVVQKRGTPYRTKAPRLPKSKKVK